MDGVSAAASIWSLLEATGAFVKYLQGVKYASKQKKELEKELSILYSLLCTLTSLKYHFPDSESWNNAISALAFADGPLAQYASTLAELRKKISSKLSVTWPFQKDDVKEMLEKMERLKGAIGLVLHIDQFKLSKTTQMGVEALGAKLERSNDSARLKDALNWISALNFRTNQAGFRSRMEENTGKWFLQTPEFSKWIKESKQTLFCPGIPGAGKTMMASGTIHHIETEILDSALGRNLAYIFCDYKAERDQPIAQLLGAILQQLVQNNSKLADPLLILYENHIEKKTFPNVGEILSAIKEVMAEHTDVYIVVDALDECPQTDRKRRQLLESLLNLSASSDVLKLLVTSRFVPEIVDKLKDSVTLEVKASEGDVRKYIRSHFDDFRAKVDDNTRTKIEDAIVKTTNGMFLVARFMVDRFAELHTMRQVKTLITRLSADSATPKEPLDVYRKVYSETLDRINSQGEGDRDLARKALMWISSAARLMTTKELCCALSIEPGDTEVDLDKWYPVDIIVLVCAGLVIVDAESDIIRLVHYTTQEFFDSLHNDERTQAHQEIATTCLTYLCFEQFRPTNADEMSTEQDESEPRPFDVTPAWFVQRWDASSSYCRSYTSTHSGSVVSVHIIDTNQESYDDTHCLVDYAANFWGFHARDCQTHVSTLALRMLSDQLLAAHAFKNATSLHRAWPALQLAPGSSTRVTGLHLAAALGLSSLWTQLVDRHNKINVNARDERRRTPLMWAAHHGHEGIITAILSAEEKYNNESWAGKMCTRGDIALNYAARAGRTSVVELLLKTSHQGRIATELSSGYEEYPERTLVYVDQNYVRRENLFGETPLMQAVLEGHDEVVRCLLKLDSKSIHREVMFGLWPIHLAVQRRPVSVVKFLIEELDVDAEIEDPKDYTPFMLAADWGNEEVVRYFIRERRAQLEANREQVAKAAHLAAANWKRLSILRFILEEARDLMDESETEALQESAIAASNVEAAIYLLSKKPAVKTVAVGADTEVTSEASRSLKTSVSVETLRDSLSNTTQASDSNETLQNNVSDRPVLEV